MPRKPKKRTREPGMVLVKRVVRPIPSLIVTDDGYRYEWPEGGEAVDVLEHHRRMVLAVKDAHLVEVELPDEPVILPAFDTSPPLELVVVPPAEPEPTVDLTGVDVVAEPVEDEPLVLALVPPTAPEPAVDLSDAWIDPATLPESEPVVEAAEPVLTAPTTAAEPVVLPPPAPAPEAPLEPVIGHLWSDADRAVAGV